MHSPWFGTFFSSLTALALHLYYLNQYTQPTPGNAHFPVDKPQTPGKPLDRRMRGAKAGACCSKRILIANAVAGEGAW